MKAHYVRVQKVQMVSEYETLPIGYWAEGYLMEDIQVGRVMQIDRRVRNGEAIRGFFTSSIVKDIVLIDTGIIDAHTENSIYRIQFIEEPKWATPEIQNASTTNRSWCFPKTRPSLGYH